LCFENLSAAQPILPHAGQNHGDGCAAVHIPGRRKQCVDGGAAGVLRRRLIQTHAHSAAIGSHLQMKVSGRNQDPAGFHRAALAGFFDWQPAGGVKTLGEEPGEEWRHVLHHQDRQWEAGRQLRQDRA